MSTKKLQNIEENIQSRFPILLDLLNFTQSKLAEELNVSQARISEFMNGRTAFLSGDVILRLLVKFRVSPEWLLNGTGATFRSEPETMSFLEYERANNEEYIKIQKILSKVPVKELQKIRELLEVLVKEK